MIREASKFMVGTKVETESLHTQNCTSSPSPSPKSTILGLETLMASVCDYAHVHYNIIW